MADRNSLGGIIHTYQKYDPLKFPDPTEQAPDLSSAAMEHLLTYGDLREFTEEELADAIHLDPSQIAGLGPSLEALLQMLRERKERILSTYEVDGAVARPPKSTAKRARRSSRRRSWPTVSRGRFTTNKSANSNASSTPIRKTTRPFRPRWSG
ncbi:MAG: hypothetical protein QM811_30985 [Pirellulales bacterium]